MARAPQLGAVIHAGLESMSSPRTMPYPAALMTTEKKIAIGIPSLLPWGCHPNPRTSTTNVGTAHVWENAMVSCVAGVAYAFLAPVSPPSYTRVAAPLASKLDALDGTEFLVCGFRAL